MWSVLVLVVTCIMISSSYSQFQGRQADNITNTSVPSLLFDSENLVAGGAALCVGVVPSVLTKLVEQLKTSTVAGASQASFSASVKSKIRGAYQYRCVICLAWISTTECVHVLDVGTQGEFQLRNAVRLGVLPEGFKRNSETNALVQCSNCRALFTKNLVVLSLPIPILQYLEEYIKSTRKGLKPLHEVFDLLAEALNGTPVDLPDPVDIIPYLGLFTLVTLDPNTAAGDIMSTPHLPGLSVILNNEFQEAPANTSTAAENVARIFDSLNIEDDTHLNFDRVPLAPGVLGFEEKRYWRLPVFAGAIFAALMARLQYDLSDCEDILLARRIVGHLMVKTSGPSGSGGPSGGRGSGRGDGPSSDRGGGGGSREGVRRQPKRKNPSGEGSPSAKKGKMKATVAGGDGAGDSGECSDASGEVLHSFPEPLGPYWNVEFLPGQSDRLKIASSTRILGHDNSDSETGRSISAVNPPDEDNPDEWRFGPSFSTNRIVFTARAVKLT